MLATFIILLELQRENPEESHESSRKEAMAHGFFRNKWGCPAHHNPVNNSKMLPFKKIIK